MVTLVRFTAMVVVIGSVTLFSPLASASIILSIDEVSVPAGSTAVVGVYAASDSSDVISGFNLPLDINADGFIDLDNNNVSDLPSGFSFANPLLQSAIYANTGFDTPQPQIGLIEVDAIPTGSGPNVLLNSAPTKLFELHVNVAASVAPGTKVPLRLIVPNSPFQALFNVAGPNRPAVLNPRAGQPALGMITVVPEPTSLMAFSSGAILILFRHRRLA